MSLEVLLTQQPNLDAEKGSDRMDSFEEKNARNFQISESDGYRIRGNFLNNDENILNLFETITNSMLEKLGRGQPKFLCLFILLSFIFR